MKSFAGNVTEETPENELETALRYMKECLRRIK